MNDAPVVPEVKEESKPAKRTAKLRKPKVAKKPVARKLAKKAPKKAVRKPAAKKARRKEAKKSVRRPFPYAKVLKMWQGGKTLQTIARAVGRYQQTADDPLHSFRVSLTRFHKGVRIGGKMVKLPHRVSKKAIQLSRKAGRRAAA
jgi:hypothetical protein